MKKLFVLLFALCSSLISAMDQQTQSLQPYHLIKHENTAYFGDKAIIYIGDINHLSLPNYMTSESRTLSGFTTNLDKNYYAEVASHISEKSDNNAYNAIVVEITKTNEQNVRDYKDPMTKNLGSKRVFNDKSITTQSFENQENPISRPFWYDQIMKDCKLKNVNHVAFIVTDEPTKSFSTIEFLSISSLGILAILFTYTHQAT